MADAKHPLFTAEQLAEARRLMALYPDKRGALLPVLHLAQDTFGYVSLEVEEYVAGLFELSPAHVPAVAAFYTMFFKQPVGRHVVAVCHNLTCHLLGAKSVIEHLKERLGVEPGETTADGRVTLLTVECLCACEQAPMMQVDDRYEGLLTSGRVAEILGTLRLPRPRRSSRGTSTSPTRILSSGIAPPAGIRPSARRCRWGRRPSPKR
jgi:NADH-quinone oxidoreductase subunit E